MSLPVPIVAAKRVSMPSGTVPVPLSSFELSHDD